MLQIRKAVSIIKKNNILILICASLIIALIILNIYQYKKSLTIKIEYGERISSIEAYALVLPSRMILDEILNSDAIDEISLAKAIEHINVTKSLAFSGVGGFSQVNSFLDNTEKDLKKLYKLIKQNGNEGEIDALIKKTTENQKKSLKTYEEIRKFFKEYMSQRNEDREDEEWALLWYRNSQGESDELIKIIERGLR
ncbi:hypothetical protein SAMN02745912_03884 [Paramaledivibacter caminithermalis DSM 15212]|jgi:hypothetical protein|uniref:Uncharacterized protein n=1 Tax=Paramaledivibacter caminithermalis (strain DSM 15212 / CIP 107654 / DViRD3) TaxID=1121301 RepID=A0A1M6U6L4_PARC5|nr:hypothetical protein SAMN02745912_03884 [Paramaledivibacter caminithermalis DSM 15212]